MLSPRAGLVASAFDRPSSNTPQPARYTRRRASLAVATCAVLAYTSPLLAQTTGTWSADVGTVGGSWSVTSNWSAGVVPGGGGAASFVTLPTFTTAPVNIIQDLPNVDLSNITFNSFITYLLRPSVATNTFTLSGSATVASNTQSINTLSATTFGQQIQTTIAGSSGLTKTGPGTVTLWAANTYTGGTNVNGGILVARQVGDSAFGDPSGSVNLNDGSIRITTGAWTTSRAINFVGNGTIEASTTGSTTFNGNVSGSGALNKIGSRGLAFGANNSFTGATNVLAGSIGLAGGGTLRNIASLTVRDTINLDNSNTANANRISDTAPVTLQGAAFSILGSTAGGITETLGATTFSRGTTTVTLSNGTAALAFGNVSRDIGAAVFFRGTGLGSATGTTAVTFATAPTLVGGGGSAGTTNISIIPWAYGNNIATAAVSAGTNSFVTYGATGLRPLELGTEYVTSILSANGTDNVRLLTPEVINSTSTINALLISGAGNVQGTGVLNVTSGAVLSLTQTAINPELNFGGAEGVITTHSTLALLGPISGSGGLTRTGSGVATLSNTTSSYTGTTTLGGGTTVFSASVPASGNGPFGSDTSAIVLAPAGLGTGGTTARLAYGGTSSVTFDRPLLVTGRVALNNAATIPGFGVNNSGTLTMNGDIELDASPLTFLGFAPAANALIINGDITGSGGPITDQGGIGAVTLNGDNTFTGGVEMATATWRVGSDTAFGDGGLLKMVQTSGQPTILAVGGARTISNPAVSFSLSANYWQISGSDPLTFTGSINLSGSYTHNINSSALTTYAGVLHTGGFTKAGTGTLVLSGNNIYTGTTTVSTGVLRVTNSDALGSVEAPTIVANAAVLELANDAQTLERVTITGTGITGTGVVRSLSGNNSLGTISVSGNSVVGVDSGALNATHVGAASGTDPFVKVGAGRLSADRYRVGNLTVNAGTLAVNLGHNPALNVSTVIGLNITGVTTPVASVDLGDNDLIASAATIATVQQQIAVARNGGAWDGQGITSAAARTNPNGSTTLGLLSGAEYTAVNSGTFDGIAVAPGDTLVKYTYYGDSDLNGLVDFDDYVRIDGGYNGGLSGWLNGDFDYSGSVDFDDYVLIDLGYNNQSGTLRRAQAFLDGSDRSRADMTAPPLVKVLEHFDRFGLDYATHFLAAVPEPGTVVSGLLASVALLARRRRQR